MPTLHTPVIPISAAPSQSLTIKNRPNLDNMSVLIPVAWTAADLKFQFSNDAGSTWFDFTDDAAVVTIITNIPTTGGALLSIPADVVSSYNALPNSLIRVVSVNTAGGADLVQAAARTLHLIGAQPSVAVLGVEPNVSRVNW